MSAASVIQEALLEKLPGAMLQTAGVILEKFWPFLLAALALSVLGRFLRSARVKGRVGEAIVSVGALKRLDSGIYRVFNDLVLPRPDGKGTTQIDHVVVSPFGIFVIETKNYAGWIFGDETSRDWTQVIYGKKSRFQNPLHQNAMHVRALAKATGVPIGGFHNLVYFAGDATLKTPLPPQVMTKGLASFIRRHRVAVLSEGQVAQMTDSCETITAGRPVHIGRQHPGFASPAPE